MGRGPTYSRHTRTKGVMNYDGGSLRAGRHGYHDDDDDDPETTLRAIHPKGCSIARVNN